jgi:hypothetical protein
MPKKYIAYWGDGTSCTVKAHNEAEAIGKFILWANERIDNPCHFMLEEYSMTWTYAKWTLGTIGFILALCASSDFGATLSLTHIVVQCLIAMVCIGVAWVIHIYKEVE